MLFKRRFQTQYPVFEWKSKWDEKKNVTVTILQHGSDEFKLDIKLKS